MSEVAELLRKKATEFTKQAEYYDTYYTAAMREVSSALGLDKEAAEPTNLYGMMDAIKQDLISKSQSPQFSMQINQARTPQQLLDLLSQDQFQIRKMAEEGSESEDQERNQEQLEKEAQHKDSEKNAEGQPKIEMDEITKKAALQHLMDEGGLDESQASTLLDEVLKSQDSEDSK